MKKTSDLLIRIGFSIEMIIFIVVASVNRIYNFSYLDNEIHNGTLQIIIGWILLLLIPKLIIGGLIVNVTNKIKKRFLPLAIYAVITIFPFLNIISGTLYIITIIKYRDGLLDKKEEHDVTIVDTW